MSYALDVEQAVAGFINTHEDGTHFTVDDIYDYVRSLWNCGLGPIRLNFTKKNLEAFLHRCNGHCLDSAITFFVINKSYLSDDTMTTEEYDFLHGDKDLAKSFILFCKLRVDCKTPDKLLDAMGFRFMYS